MKHIFTINPCAGSHDSTTFITQQVEAYASAHPDFDYKIYVTRAPGDATGFVRQWCERHPDIDVRFYACGGDGTLNEVVSGLVGNDRAEVTCYASGSGNDYIKYYGTQNDFNDIARLAQGKAYPVDVMKVNDRYSINVCNFGFDAMVCKTMNSVRRKPLIGGKRSYTTGIVRNIFTSRTNYVRMNVDGDPFHDGMMLLCTLSNGKFVGGNYQCAPLSHNNDGLLEVTLFKPLSLLRCAKMMDSYSNGSFINNPAVKPYLRYRQGTVVEMASNEAFWLCIDGEMMHSNHFRVQNLHHAVRFVAPCDK